MDSGDIYRHERLYRDAVTGELKAKYLIFLAPTTGDGWVTRLLTSQTSLRTENPPCSLAYPRPGYFLGVPGAPLTLKTWVDLRELDDVDALEVPRLVKLGIMIRVMTLPSRVLVAVLECAAHALDTTRQQERALRDQLARMH